METTTKKVRWIIIKADEVPESEIDKREFRTEREARTVAVAIAGKHRRNGQTHGMIAVAMLDRAKGRAKLSQWVEQL